jgi:hypothetical protein
MYKRKAKPSVMRIYRVQQLLLDSKADTVSKKSAHYVLQKHMFLRLLRIIDKARESNSWDFMSKSLYQAVEVYALSSVAYERHPDSILMDDALFDKLAVFLRNRYVAIPEYCKTEYKLTRSLFRSGSGLHFSTLFNSSLRWFDHFLKYEKEGKPNEDQPKVLRKNVVCRIRRRQNNVRKGA